MTMHQGQLDVTVEAAGALVAAQFPAWAALPITRVESVGTEHAIFRLGEALAARFPIKVRTVEETRHMLEAEADAARRLLRSVRVRVPEPVAIGMPGAGYPLPWAVHSWLPGESADLRDASSSEQFAHDLAEFISQVRMIDVRGLTFVGRGRGGALRDRDEWMDVCFEKNEPLVDVSRLRPIWRRLRQLPRESPDVMTHGDLIPANVLVRRGRLAGVLDVGGLGPADPALDLVAAWHLLENRPRRRLRDELGCGDLEWERGKAWAFDQAMGVAWYYAESNPSMSRMGLQTLQRILAAEAGS